MTPWTVVHQAPLSIEFSRQNWNGEPFPSSRDRANPGIKPGSPAPQADSLLSETVGKPSLLKYTFMPWHTFFICAHSEHPYVCLLSMASSSCPFSSLTSTSTQSRELPWVAPFPAGLSLENPPPHTYLLEASIQSALFLPTLPDAVLSHYRLETQFHIFHLKNLRTLQITHSF